MREIEKEEEEYEKKNGSNGYKEVEASKREMTSEQEGKTKQMENTIVNSVFRGLAGRLYRGVPSKL
jgi:hypothetical protein